MKKVNNRWIWIVVIIIIFAIFYLVSSIFVLFYPFPKTPDRSIIPEPYKNPKYCDVICLKINV